MPNASNNSARNKGESAGMRSWRSVITPPCQRKSTAVPIRIARHANYLCFAVDANGVAEKVPDESAEIGHHALLPEEAVRGYVPGRLDCPVT